MFYWIIPLVIGFILLGIFLFFRVKEKRVIAVVIKGLVSLMFIITAVVAYLTSNNPSNNFGIFIIVGLVFGLLGDVFLDIKYINEKYEYLFTSLGFITFGLGHISYISGLFLNYYSFNAHPIYLIIPAVVSLGLMLFTLLMEKFTPIRYKKMKPFVVIYGFILFFVTTIYLSSSIQNYWSYTTTNIMFFALIAFALSDLILNNTYFAEGFNTPIFIITNHVLYYIAQFAIAISLFYLI